MQVLRLFRFQHFKPNRGALFAAPFWGKQRQARTGTVTMSDKRYIEYFTPLVQAFVQDVESLAHPEISKMPEPFLPLFGKSYQTSALKLVVVGQDTYWWGDLREFIAAEKANPGSKLMEGLNQFRKRPFIRWGGPGQSFWGFTMMMIAALHGQEQWGMMKQGKMTEILNSFAWAEGNAIELYGSTAAGLGVPRDYWESVRRAGERFNRFRHIVETLRPHVAVVMYRGIHLPTYFEGYRVETVWKDGRLTHYRLPEVEVDVFHAPHPGSMNRIEGTNHFRDRLKELFLSHGLTAVFPGFLTGQEEGRKVMKYLQDKAPEISQSFDKFEFVAWAADELTKRDVFMSVPTLMNLVNAKGGTTNYGEPFSGGRGSYRLVSGTYHRMKAAGRPDAAHNVAVAFRRPNFEYAYDTE
jgi:hypothetical protein